MAESFISIKDGNGQPVKVKAETDTVGSDEVLIPYNALDGITPGTAAAQLGKAEDAAHASGDTGVAVWAKRTDTAAVSSGTDGDYSTFNVDALGKLWVTGTYLEDAAHSSGDSGILVLARRIDTRAVSSGSDGDYSTFNQNAQGDLYVNTAQTKASVSASPTCDTSAYADGDLIGGKLSFASAVRFSAGSGTIGNAVLVDQDKELDGKSIDLILFGADPTGTTFTDQAALDIADADMDKIVAVIRFGTYGDWVPFADNAVVQYTPPAGIPFKLSSGTTLYGALVARSAPTFTASTDLKAILAIVQD